MQVFKESCLRELGGAGSGNWGHIGIPGYRGGSQRGSGGVESRPDNYKEKHAERKASKEKKEGPKTDEKYDAIVKERHDALLSSKLGPGSLDNARKEDAIDETEDKAIYEHVKAGKDVIEVPKSIMNQKFGYEASEIKGAPGAYSGAITKSTEKAILFHPETVRKDQGPEWIPKSLIKWSSKKG